MNSKRRIPFATAVSIIALICGTLLAGCNDDSNSQSSTTTVQSTEATPAATEAADYHPTEATAPEAVAGDEDASASTGNYVAPDQKLRFNIAELETTLAAIKKDDGDNWLQSFEDRVNEIYEGDEVISVTAFTADNQFHIIGYVAKDDEDGYQAGDQVVFEIVQDGQATESDTPVTVSTYTYGGGLVYHHTSFDNVFLNYWLMHQLLSTPSYRYYTPRPRLSIITSNRVTFRQGPAFTLQRNRNLDFNRGTVRTLGSSGGQLTVKPSTLYSPHSIGGTTYPEHFSTPGSKPAARATPAAKAAPVYVAPRTTPRSSGSCCSSGGGGRRK